MTRWSQLYPPLSDTFDLDVAIDEKKLRQEIANDIVGKIADMCGCRNCMVEMEQIVMGDRKPFENQCDTCPVDCQNK